jgi:hypothetical protein
LVGPGDYPRASEKREPRGETAYEALVQSSSGI